MDGTAFRLKAFLLVLSSVLALATAGFVALEGLSVVDALYFSVVTVATVGYGDIHPLTPGGKLVAVFLIVAGAGTFLGVIASATDLLLARRQEHVRKERLSMIISLFFSEVGTRLLHLVSSWDPDLQEVRDQLTPDDTWSEQRFDRVAEQLGRHRYTVAHERMDLGVLSEFLEQKGGLLVRLMENQNLLEHESFTDLLRAVFHLKEELHSRPRLEGLPDSDRQHLAGDAHRVYALLTRQWLSHMEYLKENYPYLFSLAVRTNPFAPTASPVVR